jgi:alpha-galactosidase
MDRRTFLADTAILALMGATRKPGVKDADTSSSSPTAPQISSSGDSWKITNGLVTKCLRWQDGRLLGWLEVSGINTVGENLLGEIFVTRSGERWPGQKAGARLLAARPSQSADESRLELDFGADDDPLQVTMIYVSRRNDPAIEQICRLRNGGSKRVDYLHPFDSCFLSIPLSKTGASSSHIAACTTHDPVVHWVEGVHDDSKQGDEIYRTYRVASQPVPARETIDFESGKWSSNEKQPAALVQIGKLVYFAGFGWSGEWSMSLANRTDVFLVQAGVADTVISLTPGETLESPPSFYGVVQGTPEDGWNCIHTHCRLAIMPSVPDDFPWVTYNTWYNFNANLQEESLRAEVDRAVELGIEVFYLDDGWFEGSSSRGRWGRGAGKWVENKEKFPHGLAAFAEYVHDKRMKFGLWVEPERVDALFLDKPALPQRSWLATRQADLVRWGFMEGDATQPSYQVCFGCPEASEWAIESLSKMIRDYSVDWLKWDHNRYEVCEESRHGHGANDGDWAHTRGVHTVMAALRNMFPNLIIENCAAGGHRFDFGMMRHTHVTWTSDQTSPAYVSRHHIFGASHPYPPQYLTSWFIPQGSDPALSNLSPAQIDTLFRSHMLGAFGISATLGSWSPRVSASAKHAISLYKQLRPFLRGKQAWLTPQSELFSPELDPSPYWDSMQMWKPETDESVIYAFRSTSSAGTTVLQPRFLRNSRTYTVRDEDRRMPFRRVSGRTLLEAGVEVEAPEENTSCILYITPA